MTIIILLQFLNNYRSIITITLKFNVSLSPCLTTKTEKKKHHFFLPASRQRPKAPNAQI